MFDSKTLPFIGLFSLLFSWSATPASLAAESALTFDSSNSSLVDGFNFAKPLALSYVQTGNSGSIPCYWAGGLDRKAFYGRDTAHQMAGAHLLGLDRENLSMIRSFANSAIAPRKFYPLWSIGFDGAIFPIDYKSDTNFVRELPTPFDLVRRSYQQYLWTGDRQWVDDPTLFRFYQTTTHDFLQLHSDPNGIAKESGSNGIFDGIATYNEGDHENLVEAGDSFGSEYQAFLAYSAIETARFDLVSALKSLAFAEHLKAHFRQHWNGSPAPAYVRAITLAGQTLTDFGRENSYFMPLCDLTDPGTRTSNYLALIDQEMASANGEGQSYLPELFYTWGQLDTAEKWTIKVITNPGNTTTPGDRSYPEFSFTYISDLIGGVLGVEPDAPQNRVATLDNLASDTQWAASDHIPVGSHDLYVRQDRAGTFKTTLRHNRGSSGLVWEAGFYGKFPFLLVNGFPRRAYSGEIHGNQIETVEVYVPVGATVTVETPGQQ